MTRTLPGLVALAALTAAVSASGQPKAPDVDPTAAVAALKKLGGAVKPSR